MGRQRRRFTDTFKAEVAIEAVKGVKTLAELAAEYQVHPNQISDWKKQLLTNAPTLFASGKRSLGKAPELGIDRDAALTPLSFPALRWSRIARGRSLIPAAWCEVRVYPHLRARTAKNLSG